MASAPGANTTPIGRLLIANRAEIAVRIARTAHRLGIDTVGVYAEPDANALHVDAVDRAVALGGATPAESYLRTDALVQAALDTGCDAVHPGYGFLAESAAFARAVVDAGLVWVGPTPEQIELLGDKVAAKRAAVEAGVPTTSFVAVDGTTIPDGVTFPALVKAAAGGGGRGMRVVAGEADLAEAIAAASREAEAAFGDARVFVEPYLAHGRHVEVQIVGDHHGGVVHLGERECSIQRRNQKIIEETPSPGISDDVRRTLCDGALALARHVGYRNAGTVEFLVGDDTVTFLEVNTRLQVEHPVTEAVTGLDLVELQLRVASGEALPITQDDVRVDGHAIEARLVAEDPAAGWLPSTGTLRRCSIGAGVRVDTGVRAGSVVSSDYDSLLAKVIAHAPTRTEAARRLRRALRTSWVAGVRTDLECLVALLGDTDFLAGATTTAYLDEHPAVVEATLPDEDLEPLLLGTVFADEHRARREDPVTGFAPSGWRNLRTRGQRREWRRADSVHQVEYVLDGAIAEVRVGPWPEPDEDGSLPDDTRPVRRVRLLDRGDGHQVLDIDGVRHRIEVDLADDVAHVRSAAGAATFTRVPRFVDHDAAEATGGPTSPLPGTVLAVHVSVDDTVAAGDVLVVVEAMKMEHSITAATRATVTEVRVAAGDRVDAGDLLVALEPLDDDGTADG